MGIAHVLLPSAKDGHRRQQRGLAAACQRVTVYNRSKIACCSSECPGGHGIIGYPVWAWLVLAGNPCLPVCSNRVVAQPPLQ